MYKVLVFLLMISIFSCVPKEENAYVSIDLALDNSEVQKVFEFQDKMLLDSLYPFLKHIDPSLRFLATNAFSSQFNEGSTDSVAFVLGDNTIRNKATAAYALGQTYNSKVASLLIKSFVQEDTIHSVNNIANRNILEAVGKTGDKHVLAFIGKTSYLPSERALILGQTRAIYRFGLRKIYDENATEKMINYALESQYDIKSRELASSFLARSKEIDISKYGSRLLQRFIKEKNPFIKMNLASALGRTEDIDVMKVFFTELAEDNDYRVKINMIKAMDHFPYISVIEPILLRLTDKNIFVASTAADYLIKNGNKYDASIYQNYISDRNHFSLNAKIYQSVLSNLSPRRGRFIRLVNQLILAIEKSENEHERIEYIRVLGYATSRYQFVFDEMDDASIATRTAYTEVLVEMYKNAEKKYGWNSTLVKKLIFEKIRKEMLTNDAGIVAIGSLMIMDDALGLKTELIEDHEWMVNIRKNLKLPKEIETYNEISKAIAYINGTEYSSKKVGFQHPIAWSNLEGVTDSIRCIIKTTKGDITIELYSLKSPGTVANFLDLVKQDFYENKVFHRVVPNFVIQTGCPRGDGYGSMDYTIRSELGDQYYDDEGYIGMASVGKNTESTQWFITHSPAPHLDGKYTIFGKVTKGMNVVHQINVGDEINSISITSI